MSGMGCDQLFPSWNEVVARREWEVSFALERLEKSEVVDLPLCRIERVSNGQERLARFGLKRGKLLYVFKYPQHDVERDKHRNVITRARFIKHQLEQHGYRLIPWDFKKGQPPRFWDHEPPMEEDDDDLYGPSDPQPDAKAPQERPAKTEDADSSGDEPMEEDSGDDDDEEEEDDSDSDLEIIIEKSEVAKPAPQQQQQQQQHQAQPQESKAIKIEAPPQPSTATARATSATAPQLPTQSGTAYPAIKSSDIDVNGDPVYPPAGKPISQVVMDADLAEETKQWRLPGADQSDYFNYGFDEFSWEMYRSKQQMMKDALKEQNAEQQQMMAMMGGLPGPGGAPPNAPSGPSMPGMPSEAEMMQMMQQMAAQGIDPNSMDFNQMMGMMSNGGGMGGFGGPQGNQGGFGGGGGGGGHGGGGGGGGRGRGRGRGW